MLDKQKHFFAKTNYQENDCLAFSLFELLKESPCTHYYYL